MTSKTSKDDLYFAAIRDIDDVLEQHGSHELTDFLESHGVQKIEDSWAMSAPLNMAEAHQCMIGALDQAVNAFPDDPWARVARGRALVPLHYYQAALQDYARAIAMVPLSPIINLFLAETLLYAGASTFKDPTDDYLAASMYAGIAINKDPELPRAYLCHALAKAHVAALCYSESIEVLQDRSRAILEDLDMARKYAKQSEQACIDSIEREILDLLASH